MRGSFPSGLMWRRAEGRCGGEMSPVVLLCLVVAIGFPVLVAFLYSRGGKKADEAATPPATESH